jgi:hypothetical protein
LFLRAGGAGFAEWAGAGGRTERARVIAVARFAPGAKP